jgi:tyrosinase
MSAGAVTVFTGHVQASQVGPITRRTLTNMSIDDPIISTYRDFVGMMQNPPATLSANVNWLDFSLQHGNYDTEEYKFCPHGDWYFLPWHRAYTLMYEKAAQTLMKNPEFAMPYWNWTEMRDYPEAFANPQYKGKPNPLYIENRNALVGPNALTDAIVGQPLIDRIYRETVYEAFGTSKNPDQNNLDPSWVVLGGGLQGPLESRPHNQVHNRIGVFMPTPGSPRDPLFFMHHSNIDRIWASWTALGRQNSNDPLWLNMTFPGNFIKPDGTLYSSTVKDLQSIADLGYTYDFLPPPDSETPNPVRDSRLLAILHSKTGAPVAGVERIGGANTGAATALQALPREWTMSKASIESIAKPAASGGTEVFALIRDITLGEHVTGFRVFVNRPDVTPSVPTTDPHYVTTVTFLSHERGHAGANAHGVAARKHLASALVELTDTLRKLYGFRRLKPGKVTLQLIPVPATGVPLQSVGAVVPGSVEIVVL